MNHACYNTASFFGCRFGVHARQEWHNFIKFQGSKVHFEMYTLYSFKYGKDLSQSQCGVGLVIASSTAAAGNDGKSLGISIGNSAPKLSWSFHRE